MIKTIVDFLKNNIIMIGYYGHSLKQVENFLGAHLTIESSRAEKALLKATFVLFVLCHFIAASSKPDYMNVVYWVALCRSDYIADL